MNNPDSKRLLAEALRSALRAEVLEQPAPTSEEVTQALVDARRDPDAVAKQYKNLIAAKVRAANKDRLNVLRREAADGQTFALRRITERVVRALPSMDVIRSRIDMLSTKAEYNKLLLAYRNGTVQSDSDVQTLYEDLVDLGIISDESGN